MKNLLFTLTFMLVFIGAKAQIYYPMVLDGVEQQWNVKVIDYGGFPNYRYWTNIYVTGDYFEVNGHSYKALLDEDGAECGIGLREEDKKVYGCRCQNNQYIEELWYDFNLNVGDTMRYAHLNNDYMVLSSIDSILYDWMTDTYRKTYVFDEDYFYWIEGVGSNFGLLQYLPFCGYSESLLCYHENGEVVFVLDSPCYQSNTDNVSENIEQEIQVYPNPTNSVLTINIADTEYSYSLCNALGQKVTYGTAKGEKQINVNDFAKGVYHLKLNMGTRIETLKVLIE